MGVYIKGMEMPKSCHECVAGYGGCCYVAPPEADGICPDDGRANFCPLVPVPPHGRLIDKDALEADISASVVFSGQDGNAEIVGAKKIINRLHVAPTIIPAEEGE